MISPSNVRTSSPPSIIFLDFYDLDLCFSVFSLKARSSRPVEAMLTMQSRLEAPHEAMNVRGFMARGRKRDRQTQVSLQTKDKSA